ncbi:MAG TPA: hypothetical protein VLU23_09360 [Pseudolabrys sp.]|nr:hypothetical protein [Pseudolabrys sp.]
MRTALVALATLACLSTTTLAERRMFVIANDADGYGIDRCLATGEKCGEAVANAYCKTQAFAQASAYHKVDRGDITSGSPGVVSDGCPDNNCNAVAIICTR